MKRLIDKDEIIRGFKSDFPTDVMINITTICNYIEKADEVIEDRSNFEEDFEDDL